MACLLILLTLSFAEAEVFNFNEVQLIISSVGHVFGIVSKKA